MVADKVLKVINTSYIIKKTFIGAVFECFSSENLPLLRDTMSL